MNEAFLDPSSRHHPGVKSALATLWQVNDQGTLQLMSGFYEHLGEAEVAIKAEALRQAQLNLLQNEDWEHPTLVH